MSGALPPGPRGLPILGSYAAFSRDRLGFLRDVASKFGDVAYFRLGGQPTCLVSEPALIEDLLVRRHRELARGRGFARIRDLLGDGLLTSEGAVHQDHRRRLQPPFHKAAVLRHAGTMVRCAEDAMERWRDGEIIDVAHEMARLSYRIVCETLFAHSPDERETAEIAAALSDLMDWFWRFTVPGSDWLDRLPLRSSRRFERARETFRGHTEHILDETRSGADRGGFVGHLLAASDADESLTRQQVLDHALTILLAGHETMANSLAWTWHLLATAPDVEARLHAEVDLGLAGRLPSAGDLPKLPLTRAVMAESLRLRPPAWVIARRTIGAMDIGGHRVPAGTLLFFSPYVMHVDGRFHPNALEFRPERWLDGTTGSLPRYAYFPFGGGVRQCIGESFAWTEGLLLIAAVAARWRLRSADSGRNGVENPRPEPVVTLRLRGGLPMRTERRLDQSPSRPA